MATLKVNSGSAAGKSIDLDHDVVVGREGVDLTIADDPEVSRRHASIRPVDGGVVVEDLGSTNGTFVNGKRITEAVTLRTSGMVRVGTCEISIDLPPAREDTQGRQGVREVDDVTRPRATVRDPAAAAPAEPEPAAAAEPATPPPPPPPAAEPATAEQPPVAERPPEPPPPERAPSGGMPGWLPGAIAVAAAVLLALFVIISTTNTDTKEVDVKNNNLRTVLLDEQGRNLSFVGVQTGEPFGTGSVTFDQVLATDLKQDQRVAVSGKLVSRFDDGTVTGTLKDATALLQRDGSVDYEGKLTVTDGSGAYENAEGELNLTGDRPDSEQPEATFKLSGKFEHEEE